MAKQDKHDKQDQEGHESESHEPVVRDKRRIDPDTGKLRDASASQAGESATSRSAEATSGAAEGSSASEAAQAAAQEASGEASTSADSAPDSALGSEGPDPAAPRESVSGGDGSGDELFVEDILDAAEAETEDPDKGHLADLKRVTAEYANYRRRTESEREVERERAVRDAVKVLLPVLDDLDRAQKHGDLDQESSAFATIAAKLRGAVEKLGVIGFGSVGEVFDPNQHEAIFQQPSEGVSETTILEVVEPGYRIGDTLVRVAKVVVSSPA